MKIPRRATLALVVLVGAIMQVGTGVGGVEDILDPSCPATRSPSREGAAQRSEFAADGSAGRRRRILHMGNHQGLRYELAGVGRRLGLAIDFEDWPERDVCCKLNVDSDRSRWLWEQHGERWLSYDVIITSDTAPIARPLLQHVRDARTLAAGTRIVVWVCNRFDFRDNGPDRGPDHPLPQPLFPEPEFYALYAAAANGSLGAHVSVLPYTPFEAYYAGLKGVWIREPALRPAGLKSLDASGHVGEGKGGEADADLTVSTDLNNTLFLPPRGNDVLMSGQCAYLGLRCLRAGMQLASVDDWSPEHLEAVHLPIAYADARELRAFKAVVHIPYAWSTLALWEFLQAGLVVMIPTARFFLELMASCVSWGPWLCSALGEDRASTFEIWFQDFHVVTSPADLERAEWWAPEHAHVLVFFDSWQELHTQAGEADWAAHRAAVAAYMAAHTNETLARWRSLLT